MLTYADPTPQAAHLGVEVLNTSLPVETQTVERQLLVFQNLNSLQRPALFPVWGFIMANDDCPILSTRT